MITASVVAAADGEPHGFPSGFPLLPQPAEMVIGLIAFGILYWLYKTKVVPRLEELYAAQLAEARAEANSIRESAREQGASIVAEMRAQAQAEASRITESAKRQVEAERQQAVVQLRQEVGSLSTTLASKIVGESLEDEVRQKGIVDRFLAELEAGEVTPQKVAPAGQDA